MSAIQPKIWAHSADGKIRYQSLTKEYLDGALDLLRDSFFCSENVSTAIGLPNDLKARQELTYVGLSAAKHGCSIVAVDTETNKVAGASFNQLHTKDEVIDLSTFNITTPRAKFIGQCIHEIETSVNIYELCNIDCQLELLFLSTSADYRGKGIASKLAEITLEVAKKLSEGVNVKHPIDDGPQPDLEPIPKAVTSTFTSFMTQRIGKQLGFKIAAEKSFDDWVYDGVSVMSVAGKHTTKATFEYKYPL